VPEALLVALAGELRHRAATGRRFLLGITGPPGAGKSTLAEALVRRLGEDAALVPLDGFHLADEQLARLGRADRKGAPDTFDAAGFVALLRRLRDRDEPVVHAPRFRRELELAEAGAVGVGREVPLVVTEGSYLLCDGPFAPVRRLLDEVWFLDVDDELRRARLVARHVAHGRTPEAAARWVETTDEPNARVVAATRARADRVLEPAGSGSPGAS
jgi:pantothenate kinase